MAVVKGLVVGEILKKQLGNNGKNVIIKKEGVTLLFYPLNNR